MSVGRILRVGCLILLFLPAALGSGDALRALAAWGGEGSRPPSEPERIAALLAAVERSGARFVREGTEYSGAEGRRHLERKLRYAGDRIATAEEFIAGIASRSSITGRQYLVRLPGGAEMECGAWLRQKLAEIDAHR